MDWPPRSSDLIPLDFFLWGYVKERVYVNELTAIPKKRKRYTKEICIEHLNTDLVNIYYFIKKTNPKVQTGSLYIINIHNKLYQSKAKCYLK